MPKELILLMQSFLELANRIEEEPVTAFAKTASELQVDISVIRRRIYALEDWFGESLLKGRGGSVSLTRAGRLVRASAQRINDETHAVYRSVSSASSSLRIAQAIDVEGVLQRGLSYLANNYKALQPEVVCLDTAQCIANLLTGSTDLGLLDGASAPSQLRSVFVGKQQVVLAVADGHPLSSVALSVERIVQERLILVAGHQSMIQLLSAPILSEIASQPIWATGMFDALCYVRSGLGVALLPRLPNGMLPSLSGLCYRDCADILPSIDIVLAASVDFEGHQAAESLMNSMATEEH